MNFLSCYGARSTGFVMARVVKISFRLRMFHEQIEFMHIFRSATSIPQLAEMRFAEVWTLHFPFCNYLSTTCVMQDAEMSFGKICFP